MHPMDRERREREVEEFVASCFGQNEMFRDFIEQDPDLVMPLWDKIYGLMFGVSDLADLVKECRILAEKFKEHLEKIEQWEVRK